MDKIYCSETAEFQVAFFDLDPMNVVWHGNYVKYMEIGRCALLDKIGYNYTKMVESGYAFPVTDIKVRYIKPLNFGEHAKIVSSLVEYENMIKIKYEIFNEKGELATHNFSSKEQSSFNFMAAVTICKDFGAQNNNLSLFPLFPHQFAMK